MSKIERYEAGPRITSTRRSFLAESLLATAAFTGLGRTIAAAKDAPSGVAETALLDRARHLLGQAPLIDTHNDLPLMILQLSAGDLSQFDFGVRQPKLCADVPALQEGGIGAQYWSVFAESATQNTHVSLHEALRAFDVTLQIMRSNPAFEQARTADDIERIHATGKIACLMGVEGGHMIENSPAVLRIFHELGSRYLTLTHRDNVDWADSATDRTEHYGLTSLGKQLIRESNRLGTFVDLSHVSADCMRDALSVTRAPVIFSHSSAYAINPHPRNVPDDVLRRMRDNGGVVHVNFIASFVSPEGQAWLERRAAALREIRQRLTEEEAITKSISSWEASVGRPRTSIADVADHIDHIRKVAGIDHIGIGADYYRAEDDSSMVAGLGTVTRYPYLFAELLRRGYSDGDILKIAGRNHLRAMRQMEKVAISLRKTESPLITEAVAPPA